MFGAVEMRAESGAFFGDRPPLRQAEDLVAPAVGENRLVPADEAMQSASARDHVVAGPQVQMIGVAQQNLRAERLEIAMRDAFDCALRADGHERRRLDLAMGRRQHAGARATVSMRDPETKGHVLSLVPGLVE